MITRNARREKAMDVVPLSDTELAITATLRDTSVALEDPADVEVIHDLRITARVTIPDLVIQDIAAHAEHQPYGECALTVAPVGALRGRSLRRGFRREVLAAVGGTKGCSHFLTLALDLSAANVMSIYLRMREQVACTPQTRADGTWTRAALQVEPGLVNACLAFAADSPVQIKARQRPTRA